MIDLIKNIFSSYGYSDTRLDSSDLTLYSGSKGREEYWLLVQINTETDVLQEQRSYFDQCAKHIDSPALEKNLSLLLVWETSGDLPSEDLKKKIMKIEEDAYFFKKYVLHYSQQQKSDLLKELGEDNLKNFLSQKLVDQKTFQAYKKEKLDQTKIMTWQSLIYRIAIKVPFIKVDIKSEDDLDSLERENRKEIQKHQDIADLNNRLFPLSHEKKDYLFKQDTKHEELLELLEGEQNENTN
jgi:hypothetical protein